MAEANATISATAMNVFYRGLNNPVAISAGSVAESSVDARITSPHSIRRVKPGEYIVKPGVQGDKATVSVYANIDGFQKTDDPHGFQGKGPPHPHCKNYGIPGW